ncbi:IclR family transcriptional regulator [Glaciimonas soli]
MTMQNTKPADSETDADRKYTVPGLERGLRILMEFSAREPVLSAPEIARRLDIPRSTVFRILQTLESLGFLERGQDERYFRLGVAVLRLGFDYLNSLELTDLGLPIITRLRDSSGYSSQIVIRDDRHVVFVAKAASHDSYFSTVNVGTRLPAHATVLGRVLLGDLSLEELKTVFPEKHLQRFTEFTPDTVEELYQRVQEDAQRGYAISQSFFEKGISVITAPVRNDSGKIVAAISLTLPVPMIDQERLAQQHLVDDLVAAAMELSRQLNYRGDAKKTTHPFEKALGLR